VCFRGVIAAVLRKTTEGGTKVGTIAPSVVRLSKLQCAVRVRSCNPPVVHRTRWSEGMRRSRAYEGDGGPEIAYRFERFEK
jgi:hypothetical protein